MTPIEQTQQMTLWARLKLRLTSSWVDVNGMIVNLSAGTAVAASSMPAYDAGNQVVSGSLLTLGIAQYGCGVSQWRELTKPFRDGTFPTSDRSTQIYKDLDEGMILTSTIGAAAMGTAMALEKGNIPAALAMAAMSAGSALYTGKKISNVPDFSQGTEVYRDLVLGR